jgi:LPXTG-motif cell wall-anchored protein
MFRPNLRKAALLGLGIASLTSNIVFAQVRIAPEENQRSEIAIVEPTTLIAMDRVDLPDSGEAIDAAGAEQGEGVTGNEGNIAVEITDYRNEVVLYNTGETKEELIYSTEVVAGAEDADMTYELLLNKNDATEEELMYTTGIADGAETDDAAAPDQAVSSEDDFKVQITSVGAEDIRTVAAENAPISDTDTDKGAIDSSVIVLAIAGGAVLIGGSVLVSKRKKDK